MTWFDDLSEWTYYGYSSPQLKAIGWLSKEHPYPRGEVSRKFFLRLCQLLQKPNGPLVACGFHVCELCHTEMDAPKEYKGLKIPSYSNQELFVPGQGFLYVTPMNIAHYIDSHGYCPPAEFQQAVLACPDTDSEQCEKAFLDNGGLELMRWLQGPARTAPPVKPELDEAGRELMQWLQDRAKKRSTSDKP